MYKLDLPVNERELNAIKQRQQRDEERKKRIFDTALQKSGVDHAALDAQIQEKERLKQLEREREAAESAEAMRQERVLMLLEKRQQADQKALLQSTQAERAEQIAWKKQQQEQEAALDNLPAQFGASSLQEFAGEDPHHKERMRQQSEQQKQWAIEKMQEEEAQRQHEAHMERLSQLRDSQTQSLLAEKDALERESRRQELAAANEYNRRMAEEKSTMRQTSRAKEMEDNYRDQLNQANSELLSEDPSLARSPNGRIQKDRFRGFTEEQLQQIKDEQMSQIEEMKIRREQEKRAAEIEARNDALIARTIMLEERKRERMRKEEMAKANNENARLAAEQRARRDASRRLDNQVDDSFYAQFQRDAR